MQNSQENKKILSVKDLSKYFTKSGKIFKVLDEISFDIYEGDFFGVIGESGSGKSTTGKCVIRLHNSNGGIITFMDKIINNKKISKNTKLWLTKNMQMVFQDPMSSLNPRKNIMSLISEPLVINKSTRHEAKKLINSCHIINPYFTHVFRWQDYKLNNKYYIPYLKKSVSEFYFAAKSLKEFNASKYKDIESLQDDLSNIFINYENCLTSNFNLLNNLLKNTENNIFINYEKLKNGKIDETEIDFVKAEEELYKAKEEYRKSQEWIDCKQRRDNLIEEKKQLEHLMNSKYKEQNSVFISSLITDFKNQSALYQQRRKTTIDLFEYSLNKIKAAIAKDVSLIMEKISGDIYLSVDEIKEFSEKINQHVSAKYETLMKRVIDVSNKNEAISNDLKNVISVSEKSVDLYPELSTYYDSYKELDELIDKKIEEDFLLTSKTIKKIVHDFTKKSKQNKNELLRTIKLKSNEITKLDNELDKIRIAYTNSDLKNENYKKMISRREKMHNKKHRRNHFIELDEKYFTNRILPLIEKQEEEIREHNKLINIQIKTLKHIQREVLRRVKNTFKEVDEDFKINYINLKTEFKNRMNNIVACNIQYHAILDKIDLFKSLRSKNKLILNLNRRELEKVLISEKVYDALNQVGLKSEHAFRYPHEFSGGQRQRIVIARSLISDPKFIIADEPISALDVSIQAQVVNIMKNLSIKKGITFMFIAHDLSMVNFLCNRLIILHKGKIVEKGNTSEIFNNPIHPYTISLIKASPELSKIHVDLSSFDSDLNYDKNYSMHNKPTFHKVPNDSDHYVFCSEGQFKKWVK